MADQKDASAGSRVRRATKEDTVTVVPEAERPTMSPPGSETGQATGSVGLTEPKQLTNEQLADSVEAAVGAGPTLAPPGPAGAVAAEAAAGIKATWQTGVIVTALWSINEIRNAWMYVSGLGWRKIFNGRDGAFTALVTLASQARQTGRQISFREEADGMVYEIYLW
jgi:hypothetical protein